MQGHIYEGGYLIIRGMTGIIKCQYEWGNNPSLVLGTEVLKEE
jgi:hypothetical protein